jgi:hypothetical protein
VVVMLPEKPSNLGVKVKLLSRFSCFAEFRTSQHNI